MDAASDDDGELVSSLSGQFSPDHVDMTLTQCGLLPGRTEELAQLYRNQGNWNDVKDRWFEERVSTRSTKNSSQNIFRVLSSRLKTSSTNLPRPDTLPTVLNNCVMERDKAQSVYFYLVLDDPLFRYTVHEYISRLLNGHPNPLDFSDAVLTNILFRLEFTDESKFDYADSTTQRWCEGFRSVMREIGVLEDKQATSGSPPPVGEIPLLVSVGYSYEAGGTDWANGPTGLLYLFQPERRWDELFDRVASTDAWEFVELHGDVHLRPTGETYGWTETGGEA